MFASSLIFVNRVKNIALRISLRVRVGDIFMYTEIGSYTQRSASLYMQMVRPIGKKTTIDSSIFILVVFLSAPFISNPKLLSVLHLDGDLRCPI